MVFTYFFFVSGRWGFLPTPLFFLAHEVTLSSFSPLFFLLRFSLPMFKLRGLSDIWTFGVYFLAVQITVVPPLLYLAECFLPFLLS